MRIIDLLNKIANNGEVPKKVIYKDFKYKFNGEDYYDKENDELLFRDSVFDMAGASLNDEVEILEEEKKIPEKLDIGKMLQTKKWKRDKKTWEAINSIIDYLKSKGE